MNQGINQETLMGMVLSVTNIGDYDKRLVILTKERGKIAAFVKGIRKPGNPLMACGQPFSFGNFTLLRGKNWYTLLTADITSYFESLRLDLDSVYYGLYFCEYADFFSNENMDGTNYLKLLYQALKSLTKKTIPYPLVRYIFELKMSVFNGEALQMFECVRCGKGESGYFLSVKEGGMLCDSCKHGAGNGIHLSEASLYTLQFILATPVEKLFTFHVSEEVLHTLQYCMEQYSNQYIGHEFHTLSFLKML